MFSEKVNLTVGPLQPAVAYAKEETVSQHRHPVNRKLLDEATFGQRAAETMAKAVGSWRFLIIQSLLVACWIVLNVTELLFQPWDVYPFVLLNLLFSVQAAYTGPILLIAANRSAERDRQLMQSDHHELELEQALLDENTALTREIHTLTTEVHGFLKGKG